MTARHKREPKPSVLVVDIGGTHVKVLASGRREPMKIPSGPTMTPARMVAAVKKAVAGWTYSAVSIGYPGAVLHGKPVSEPHHLASGWVGFDFKKAFGCPVRVINDAAMQALGSYRGGRMLFLGLGTGLGTALIVDRVLSRWSWRICRTRKGARTKTTSALPG
jgi:predicted NBD/HSP70 family sugar kinase